MKRSLLSAVLVLAVVAAVVAPAQFAAGKGKKSGPVVVGTDDPADWGSNVDGNLAPLGDALGQELVEASIAMADAATVNLIIKVKSLPASGGVPEITRYTWDLFVDGEAFTVTGGFTEYVRGTCRPDTANTCPPPRDPGSAPFFIKQGACSVGTVPPDCEEVAIVHATFDAAAGTITIPVGLEVFGAKAGSKIEPGAGWLGPSIYSAPQASVSANPGPWDTMTVTGIFTVPKHKH